MAKKERPSRRDARPNVSEQALRTCSPPRHGRIASGPPRKRTEIRKWRPVRSPLARTSCSAEIHPLRSEDAVLSPSARIAGPPFAGLRLGYYGAIMVDVPWHFRPWAAPNPEASGRRDTERHYATMSLAAI